MARMTERQWEQFKSKIEDYSDMIPNHTQEDIDSIIEYLSQTADKIQEMIDGYSYEWQESENGEKWSDRLDSILGAIDELEGIDIEQIRAEALEEYEANHEYDDELSVDDYDDDDFDDTDDDDTDSDDDDADNVSYDDELFQETYEELFENEVEQCLYYIE